MGVLAKEIEANYEVLAKMGEGGMGAVYKVRHRFFDEIRVIKVMQPQLEPVTELQERFLGEAKRGKQLRHPNLAEVIDFSIASDGTYYIVMEYIEGVNLRDVLARNGGPLDYRTVVPIAEQALAALGFLHSRRFIHRDISPDNLMLTSDGGGEPRVKLIDLGIAKSLEATQQLTMAGKFLGKVKYASPEQFGGKPDGRSDLYSLGIVLYELLTGAMPITGDNHFSVIAGHMTRPPRSFEETDPGHRVPPPIRQAVLKALEKRPEDRYQDAASFAEALREAIPPSERRTVEEPIITRPAEAMPVAVTEPEVTVPDRSAGGPPPAPAAVAETRGVPRQAWYAVAALAAVLVIAAATALWLTRQPKVERPPVAGPPAATVSNTIAGPGATVTVEPPPVVEKGQLLINAFPWGEVASVTNAAGVEQLSTPQETPLLLTLPAGAYKVRLTNPNSNRSVVLDASVKANVLARCETELDRIDAGAYVDRIGIGR